MDVTAYWITLKISLKRPLRASLIYTFSCFSLILNWLGSVPYLIVLIIFKYLDFFGFCSSPLCIWEFRSSSLVAYTVTCLKGWWGEKWDMNCEGFYCPFKSIVLGSIFFSAPISTFNIDLWIIIRVKCYSVKLLVILCCSISNWSFNICPSYINFETQVAAIS